MARRAARLKSRTWRARRHGPPGTVLGRFHQMQILDMLFSASRSYDMLDEERPVRRETLLHTSLCCLCRMQATRSHHVGLCLRRRTSSKGARMPIPPAQRKASTLMGLQGDYDTDMLKYRCGMQHRRRACRPIGVCILAAAKCSRCRCKCRGSPEAKGLARLTVAPALRHLAGNGECR